MIRTLLTLAMPLIMGGVGLYALGRGVDVFSALTDGMRDGLKTLLRIFPSLLALLPAIAMVRASGLLDAVTGLLSPVLAVLGIPEQLAPLLLLRPLSGSGALAAATDLIGQYGADSLLGRTAAVMLGSTETTFYVLAVYFGAADIQKGRRILPAALLADLVGFVMAAQTVRCFWG
ncbi:MAG: spore maturation protein [Oscillospiraceae bacterium]|nr:spore maturation protein [Oscillospiraceae bacterium]